MFIKNKKVAYQLNLNPNQGYNVRLEVEEKHKSDKNNIQV